MRYIQPRKMMKFLALKLVVLGLCATVSIIAFTSGNAYASPLHANHSTVSVCVNQMDKGGSKPSKSGGHSLQQSIEEFVHDLLKHIFD